MMVLLWTAQTSPGLPKIGVPVGHKISLAGTFGELRPDHFHTGMDIKSSQGTVGDSIFAVDDGFIHRIVVSSVGFGYGLYISHPHGYTSVYGHLHGFRQDLAEYTYQHQIKVKSWAINAYPGPEKFRVKRGDFIGYLGNSGSSQGPHLHFEMRRSSDSRLFNPSQFGIPYEDNIKPYIKYLAVYRRGYTRPVHTQPVFGDLAEDTLQLPVGEYALGLEIFDQMNGSANRNGIQSVELVYNDRLTYQVNINELAFSDNRYTNALLDYQLLRTEDRYVYRLFNLPGNKFQGSQVPGQGYFSLPGDGQMHQARIIVKDAHGNTRLLHVNLQANAQLKDPPVQAHDRLIRPEERFQYLTDYFQVDIPPYAFYEKVPWSLLTHKEHDPGIFSTVYQLMDCIIPVAEKFTIRIKPHAYPPAIKEKLFIARCDDQGEMSYQGGEWQEGFIKARCEEFGTFLLMADTVAPTITLARFPLKWSGQPQVAILITDNVEGNPLTYNSYLGTTWIPMAYDAKIDLLFFDHKISFPPGEHEFRLIVEDGHKNKAEFKRKISIQ